LQDVRGYIYRLVVDFPKVHLDIVIADRQSPGVAEPEGGDATAR